MTPLYRTVWRWHFFAGIVVLPVLAWLAVTGGLYLYKAEIERLVYRGWVTLEAPRGPMPARMPADAMVARVEAATGARVRQIVVPAAAATSWRMLVAGAGGERTAFVDPRDGRVLGTTSPGGVMETVRALHSLAITGPVGNALVEIVAGWAIVLVVSGLYLWWPRAGQAAFALRGTPRERRFWRDFHASVGACAGAVLLFLAVTGMPWSIVWGEWLQSAIAAGGVGRPPPPVPHGAGAGAGDAHDGHAARATHAAHDALAARSLSWSMQARAVPAAGPVAGPGGGVGVGSVLRIAAARGLTAPLTLTRPADATRPYAVARVATGAAEARVLYVDPASGAVLGDVGAADVGWAARAVEWGIYTHQGETYGEANRLVMLAGCIGVLLLAGSAPVLWWKRRHRGVRGGRLSAPPRGDARAGRGFVAGIVALGVLLPLTGATMLAAMVGERAWRRARRRARGVA